MRRYDAPVAKDLFPNYPRAEWHLPDGDPVGRDEMSTLTGRSLRAVAKWIERRALPPADGPIVHGLPTWRRRTFLAWAYSMGFLVLDGKEMPDYAEGHAWCAEMGSAVPKPVRDMQPSGAEPTTERVAEPSS